MRRVERTPEPLEVLIERSYQRLRVRVSHGKLGGGNYTATLIGYGTSFEVGLSPRALGAGVYGSHMTVHELGHVVVNAYFGERDYNAMFQLFQRSPSWRDCFPAAPSSFEDCVPPDEILAEQIAFLGSPRWFRTSYEIPPLAARSALLGELRRVR